MIALYFDTETTGFPNHNDPPAIVQIGAMLEDLETERILGELNVIVKSSKLIPEAASDIHGITDELSATYGIHSDVADNMFALLAAKADVIVAHNIEFDMTIVRGVWPVSRAILADKAKFCTMLESTAIVGIVGTHANGNKWPKLIEAHQYFFNEGFDGAHDAMADVRACARVFHELKKLADTQLEVR